MSKRLSVKQLIQMEKENLKSYQIDDETLLIRYMDLSKFLSLLENGLYLTRADEFEDPLEGSLPDWFKKLQVDKNRVLRYHPGRQAEHKQECIKIMDEVKKLKEKAFISCWNAHTNESYAMWKIYAKDQGVAIQTTKGKLQNLVEGTSAKIYKVDYKLKTDFYTATPELDENLSVKLTMNTFVQKKSHYQYEDEVRLILFSDEGQLKPIPIPNPEEFIDKIYIRGTANILT